MFRNSGKLTSSMNSNISSNKENYNHINYKMSNLIEIKSKFDAEFRRFSIQRNDNIKFIDFYKLIEHFHKLFDIEFSIFYTDPILGDLLPINNDDNFAKAISSAKPTLKLIVQRKGESCENSNGVNSKKKHFLGNLGLNLLPTTPNKMRPSISMPADFRQVSAIIDVDIVPDTCRRVRLVKHGSDKPLGFYIRDGTSLRVTPNGIDKVPGIFISRLVPGGLAESTGLLAVNDEVLEVNCIQVNGKTLDQVTDMMVANSSNLIITIRPANQRSFNLPPHNTISSSHSPSGPSPSGSSEPTVRNSVYRVSQNSQESCSRNDSAQSVSDDEEDEVKDHFESNIINTNTNQNTNIASINKNNNNNNNNKTNTNCSLNGKCIVTTATINTITTNNNNNNSITKSNENVNHSSNNGINKSESKPIININNSNNNNNNSNESDDDDCEDVVRL